jgi:hypothetical protein
MSRFSKIVQIIFYPKERLDKPFLLRNWVIYGVSLFFVFLGVRIIPELTFLVQKNFGKIISAAPPFYLGEKFLYQVFYESMFWSQIAIYSLAILVAVLCLFFFFGFLYLIFKHYLLLRKIFDATGLGIGFFGWVILKALFMSLNLILSLFFALIVYAIAAPIFYLVLSLFLRDLIFNFPPPENLNFYNPQNFLWDFSFVFFGIVLYFKQREILWIKLSWQDWSEAINLGKWFKE